MKYYLLIVHIIFSFTIAQAQFDSLAIEIYAQVPINGQNFDLANTFGIKLGKINSHHKFSLGYGTFKTRSSWVQYYDDNNSRWTTNSLILHSYSDSMPANARRGKVTTTSYAINVSWSREPAIRHISLYSAISFTAFINQLKQTEFSSLAYITDGIEGNTEIEQGSRTDELVVGYTDTKTTSDTRYNSFTPSMSIAAGAVFRFGDNLKLIPMLNVGAYIKDQRVYSGSLYGRANNIAASVRPAFQLTYVIK